MFEEFTNTMNKKVEACYSTLLLNQTDLNHQCNLFRGAMKANTVDALEKTISLNPLTKLRRTMSMVVWSNFHEGFKVVKLVVVQVLGFVEDENNFSTILYFKSKL